MSVQRYFLNWDVPLAQAVTDFLLPPHIDGTVDLGKELVVVPTRQAGRRLREALALQCSQWDAALLSPHVVTPTYFLYPDEETRNVATQTDVTAVWTQVLMEAELGEYESVFPARAPEQDFNWAIYTGEMIQRLRDTLADGGYRIADVYRDMSSVLEEVDRWRDLSKLEEAYLKRLEAQGKQDPVDFMIRRAENPPVPEEVERIVVAAVPDPTPLMVRALDRLAEQVPVSILAHAPESLADRFDKWGCPIPEKWQSFPIDIPQPESNLVLAGSPSSQSRKMLEVMASESQRFGPADIAVGVPDKEVTPFLEADLSERELPTFDPAGRGLREHPLYQFLETFQSLVTDGSCTAFTRFLRNADVLNFLKDKYNLSTFHVLKELDDFKNEHLPQDLDDIGNHLDRTDEGFANLKEAFAFVRRIINDFQSNDMESSLRSLLQVVYETRMISPNNTEDRYFMEAARLVDNGIREMESECVKAAGLENRHALSLLLHRLQREQYYPDREGSLIDLEGWLELPWDDAPLLIITGMNEGSVPDSQLSDVFLPDSLRALLNIRDDTRRVARDAYLMSELVESRKNRGRVCFIAGKTNSRGDPLTPSRLLFRCRDNELPDRARRLFGDPEETQASYAPTISFRLKASPHPTPQPNLRRISVTQFRDYLQCPFRFYLKHVLGMESYEEKSEMDALDFGTLVHHSLRRMAESGMQSCERVNELGDFLCAEAEDWATGRFGASLPLQVSAQLDAARNRLRAAARKQVELVKEGWEILEAEYRVEKEINGLTVVGQIDRIDRNLQTGQIRILDYKTSDTATEPERFHLAPVSEETPDYARIEAGGKERRWLDLQLPLYLLLLPERAEFSSEVKVGYFNLPKGAGETGVTEWSGFDRAHLESARTCAEGVVRGIRSRQFWPPSSKVAYEEFQSLFHADIPGCIDVEEFKVFMEGYQGKVSTNDHH